MAYNGAGVFSLYTPGNPVLTGTTISSTWANNTLTDIATGLSTALLKDGTQVVTADIPMATHKFTGLSAGSAAGHSLRYEQVYQASSLTFAAIQSSMEAGASNLLAVTPAVAQYHPSTVKAWVNFTGSGTVTINLDYGVDTITDNGAGDYTVNFTVAFSGAQNYCGVACAGNDGAAAVSITSGPTGSAHTASAWRFGTFNSSFAATDYDKVSAMFSGDQ